MSRDRHSRMGHLPQFIIQTQSRLDSLPRMECHRVETSNASVCQCDEYLYRSLAEAYPPMDLQPRWNSALMSASEKDDIALVVDLCKKLHDARTKGQSSRESASLHLPGCHQAARLWPEQEAVADLLSNSLFRKEASSLAGPNTYKEYKKLQKRKAS